MTPPTGDTRRASIPPDAPRLLIIGRAGAGKTSLIGGLARAAEVQETTLGARYSDTAGRLRAARDYVYQSAAPPADREYPVRIEPFEAGKVAPGRAWTLVIAEGPPDRELARADAVMFVVDCGAADDEFDRECREFGSFIERFRRDRGRRADEPLLPVFLVLTKADQLAKAGDSRAVWTERLEMAKEELSQRYEAVAASHPGFGSLAVHVAATSVRPPALGTTGPSAGEPYGAAELFAEAAAAARDHADRKTRGEKSIRTMVMAAALLAAGVAGFAAVSPFLRSTFEPAPALAALVGYRNTEAGSPAAYLEPPLAPRIEQLLAIARDPTFGKLSESDRAFVTARLDELNRFQALSERFQRESPPTELRSEADLQRLETLLGQDLKFPGGASEAAWAQSALGKTRDLWTRQIPAIRSAVNGAAAAFDARRQTIDKLFVLGTGPIDWSEWAKSVDATLAAGTPVNPSESLNVPVAANGRGMKAGALLEFAEVAKAAERFNESTRRLQRFRQIAGVSGLAPANGPSLQIPDGFRIDQAPPLWDALVAANPEVAAWGVPDVPDAAVPAVTAAANRTYARLVPTGRALVRGAYGSPNDGPESPNRWRNALDSLAGRPEMKAWNDLARLALRLAGENTDPFAEFQAFVRKDRFELAPQSVDVVFPASARFVPTGSWILFVQPPGGQASKKLFRAPDSPTGDRIRFSAADAKPLTFRPGDLVWAELGVTDATKADLQLTWWANGVRSKVFQFDRLARPPRLHPIDQKAETGQVADGVRIEFQPPGSVPRIPDLMPEMP
jgi:GTP-binding protein EngB required for normal cell division